MKPGLSRSATPRTMVVAVMLGAALTVADAKASSFENCDRALTDIQRYCAACWRNARLDPDSWNDCTQEVLARLLQRVPISSWNRVLQLESDERREFVRAIDAVKKRTQRSRKYSALAVDHPEEPNRSYHEEREQVQRAAREVLSHRQQRILQMSFDGFTVQEVADELTMSTERVSDEKYKAIRKLRTHLGIEVG